MTAAPGRRRLRFALSVVLLAVACIHAAPAGPAQGSPASKPKGPGYDDTPFLPDSEWRVHDSRRPRPPIVDPGKAARIDLPAAPPSDATVLFDGADLSAWKACKKGGGPAAWKVENGVMEVVAEAGAIETREHFGDGRYHIEWSAPLPVKGSGQGRGNSGVFLMGRYEIQVLDSYENETYADGQAAALYGQAPPLVNACRPPGEWNVFDIVFTAPVFEDGEVAKPGYVTLFHNGVLVHNHVALLGQSAHKKVAKYRPHPPKGPVRLQDHKNPVRFRNIWYCPRVLAAVGPPAE